MGNNDIRDTGELEDRKYLHQNPRPSGEAPSSRPHSEKPDSNIIICPNPNCGNKEFEFRLICNLRLRPDGIITEDNAHRIHSCAKCGYNISDAKDLALKTIDVYIVGDSISGRRQGLNKMYRAWPLPVDKDIMVATMMDELARDGYSKRDSLSEGYWIFTKSAWKRAQQDPEFRLSDGQYTVNVKEMI